MKERNIYFDYLKGFACIAVVFLHFRLPGYAGLITGALSKFAVPVFFMISGYYALSKNQYNPIRKIIHILKITILAECIIFIYELLKTFAQHQSIKEYLLGCFGIEQIFQTIVFNKPLNYGYLWFLYALIYCYIALWVLRKIGLDKTAPLSILAGGWYIAFVVLSEATVLIGKDYYYSLSIFGQTINVAVFNIFIFRALPWFLIGRCFKINCDRLSVIKMPTFTLVLIGSISEIFEYYSVGWLQFYIGTFVVSVSLFWAAMNGSMRVSPNRAGFKLMQHIGEKDSDFVYIAHMIIGSMLITMAKLLPFIDTNSSVFIFGKTFIVILISLGLAEIRNFCKSKLLKEIKSN